MHTRILRHQKISNQIYLCHKEYLSTVNKEIQRQRQTDDNDRYIKEYCFRERIKMSLYLNKEIEAKEKIEKLMNYI